MLDDSNDEGEDDSEDDDDDLVNLLRSQFSAIFYFCWFLF